MLGLGLGLGLDTDGLVNVTARLQDFLHNGLLLICFQFWTCAVMFFKTKTNAVKTNRPPRSGLEAPTDQDQDTKTTTLDLCATVLQPRTRTRTRSHDIKTAESESGKHGLGNHASAIGWTHPIGACI